MSLFKRRIAKHMLSAFFLGGGRLMSKCLGQRRFELLSVFSIFKPWFPVLSHYIDKTGVGAQLDCSNAGSKRESRGLRGICWNFMDLGGENFHFLSTQLVVLRSKSFHVVFHDISQNPTKSMRKVFR